MVIPSFFCIEEAVNRPLLPSPLSHYLLLRSFAPFFFFSFLVSLSFCFVRLF